jgi:predicted enzyme related to lactoylglutathione lyase
MSERDGYEPGVPCWVATTHPDPQAALSFYTELFGWEVRESPDGYSLCTLRGRDVAAIGEGSPPAWHTHVWVDSADDTAVTVTEAGGSVVAEPSDIPGVARVALLADPAGAVFGVWQPREHLGARLVNEPGAWSMGALNSPDPDRAKEFYGAVFGWVADTMDLGEGAAFTMFRLTGYEGGEPEQPVPRDVIATMLPASGDDVPPHWSPDFWVGDSDAAADRAAELGGQVLAPPYDIPGTPLRQAVVADPQGATFSVTMVNLGP